MGRSPRSRTGRGGPARVPVDRATAREAGALRRRFGPSHGTGLADAIVASSAVERSARIVTFNRKPFPFAAVLVPYRR